MASKPAPAIRTRYDDRYSDIERIATIGSDTRFHRGLGHTGTKVELADVSAIGGCPRCGEHKMVVSLDLHPDGYDDAVFYCTNFECPHFVQDAVEYDMNRIRADEPEVWDNSAECPNCGTRHTVEVKRHTPRHDATVEGTSCLIEEPCEECMSKVEA